MSEKRTKDSSGLNRADFLKRSGAAVGGMFNDPAAARPHWLFVFNVDDIDAAEARLTANGGEKLRGPDQVPTGDWVINARDPQGARFALVGPKR